MDFDSLAGKLWDTDNGPAYGDEINLVPPGFNSGWGAVHGIWRPVSKFNDIFAGPAVTHPNNLVTFQGKRNYDQGKSTRDIAKELRMSLTDIITILRKNQASHGIAITDNGNIKNNTHKRKGRHKVEIQYNINNTVSI